jgi:hypothetical protein
MMTSILLGVGTFYLAFGKKIRQQLEAFARTFR